MRRIGDQATRYRDGPGRDRQPAAIMLALLFGLAACAPIKPGEPPKTTASPNPPVTTERLAPVALAPGMTGGPAASPSAKPAATPSVSPVAAAAPPAEPPAPASPPATPPAATPPAAIPPAATRAAATPAVAAAPPAPPPPPGVSCPLGTIGMWSQPDIIGKPVYICRQLNALH
ncbi:MAG TPA: hypothetical protein VNF04_00510 [Stellaceae bacterium]|nr:hypothetical protein [Stellaceae bacterium]